MSTSGPFKVYRARPTHAGSIADFVSQATHGRVAVGAESVIERFGVKGLWLAEDAGGQIVGLAGWRAENLVARIDDFLIFPGELYATAGKTLLDGIEDAAQELQCEVCMLFVPLRAAASIVDFYIKCGYTRPETETLPRVWQETIQEATQHGRFVIMKQLRKDLVVRPM